MANKHKNRINPNTGDRQDRLTKANHKPIQHKPIVAGKDRLSTSKPVSLSATDKARFETQSKLGKGLIYILGNGLYLEFSVLQQIKRLCIGIVDQRNKKILFTPRYPIADLSFSIGIDKPSTFYERLCSYCLKYGYTLELT